MSHKKRSIVKVIRSVIVSAQMYHLDIKLWYYQKMHDIAMSSNNKEKAKKWIRRMEKDAKW